MHLAEALGAKVIVRGLRTGPDFEHEFPMAAMNQQMLGDTETIFLPADPRHQKIASRLVKDTARLGGTIGGFVSPGVEDPLRTKCPSSARRGHTEAGHPPRLGGPDRR